MARGARRAKGKRSYAISDRSGFKVPYKSLKTTWDGLRVEPEDWEPKHPQLTPAKNVIDATALFQPRPDNDPENVDIFYGYNYDPFIDPRDRPPVGIPGFSRIGFVNIEGSEDVTGVAGTGAIGSFSLGVIVTGVAGTGTTGTATPQIVTEVTATGVNGTGAAGTVYPNPDITGASGTGAIGTEVPESEITETGVAGTGAVGTSTPESELTPTGVAGTGAVGTEVPESESTPSGVAGTGAVEGFGISGNGVLQVLVTGVAGVGATGTTGSEVAESEISETGLGGTGNIGAVSIQVDYGWGEGTWSEDVWGE